MCVLGDEAQIFMFAQQVLSWLSYLPKSLSWFNENDPHRSYVWILVSHMVELFGKDWGVWPCWRICATWGRFRGFKSLRHSQFALCVSVPCACGLSIGNQVFKYMIYGGHSHFCHHSELGRWPVSKVLVTLAQRHACLVPFNKKYF